MLATCAVAVPSNERSLIPIISERTHLLFHIRRSFKSKYYE